MKVITGLWLLVLPRLKVAEAVMLIKVHFFDKRVLQGCYFSFLFYVGVIIYHGMLLVICISLLVGAIMLFHTQKGKP